MPQRQPLVSVCLPTINRAEMLKEALSSVLAQTFQDFELIVSDNASSDGTPDLVASIKDTRIRYIRNDKNIGGSKNFNQCLGLARGAYISIFHDDDIMLPDNLFQKVSALDRNPSVGFLHSKFHIIDERGTIVEVNTNFGKKLEADHIESGHTFLSRSLLGSNLINASTVMMRREVYQKVGGFDARLGFTADFEYWMRAALYYDVFFLANPLMKYRTHFGAATEQYLTRTPGSTMVNPSGVVDEFMAKRIILKRSKSQLQEWPRLRVEVQKWMREKLVGVIDTFYLQCGDRRGARKCLLYFFRKFPDLFLSTTVVPCLLKTILGPRAISSLKRLTGNVQHAGKQS